MNEPSKLALRPDARRPRPPSFRDKSPATAMTRPRLPQFVTAQRTSGAVEPHGSPWHGRLAPCPSIAPLEGDNIGHDVSDLVSGQRDARHRRMWNDDLSREIFCGRPWPSSDSREAWNIRPHRTGRGTIDDVASDTESRGKLTSALRVAGTRLRKDEADTTAVHKAAAVMEGNALAGMMAHPTSVTRRRRDRRRKTPLANTNGRDHRTGPGPGSWATCREAAPDSPEELLGRLYVPGRRPDAALAQLRPLNLAGSSSSAARRRARQSAACRDACELVLARLRTDPSMPISQARVHHSHSSHQKAGHA